MKTLIVSQLNVVDSIVSDDENVDPKFGGSIQSDDGIEPCRFSSCLTDLSTWKTHFFDFTVDFVQFSLKTLLRFLEIARFCDDFGQLFLDFIDSNVEFASKTQKNPIGCCREATRQMFSVNIFYRHETGKNESIFFSSTIAINSYFSSNSIRNRFP